jgi:ABC-type spermidine/putrescine transport system permease subunit II
LYNVIDLFSSTFIISGTIIAIIFGYCVRFLAISINNFEAGFSRIPQTYDDAAKILDVGEKTTFVKIFIPLLKNSAFASFIIVFIEVIKELPLTMILRPFNYDTLPILALELTQQSQIVDLENISFDVKPGEIVTLLGSSGCGKTTILRSIAGLQKEHEGSICIGNECVSSKKVYKKDICFI